MPAALATLMVMRHAPYPARTGAPLRMWQQINVFAQRGPVSVFSVGDREPDAVAIPNVDEWLHIDRNEYVERPYSGAARIKKLVRPRQFPLHNDYITRELNDRLAAFMRERKPDVIVLSHWTDAFPDALKSHPNVIVDAHNIESSLAVELDRSASPKHLSIAKRLEHQRFRAREHDLFRHAARNLVVSESDARLYATLGRDLAPPVVWPNAVDVSAYESLRERTLAPPAMIEPNGATIGFTGFYAFPPNARAARTLIEEIFPRVRARVPHARLLLIGKDPTPEMLAAARADPGIVVTGSVDDIRAYLAAVDVSAMPLTEGGGTRLKLLEAFAATIPVVCTPKAAEGLAVEHGTHVLIASDPATLADQIVASFADGPERRARTAAALGLVRERYSWDALARRLDDALPPSLHHR